MGVGGRDCRAWLEQKALITGILQKAAEEVLKVIEWRNKEDLEPPRPLQPVCTSTVIHKEIGMLLMCRVF